MMNTNVQCYVHIVQCCVHMLSELLYFHLYEYQCSVLCSHVKRVVIFSPI